MRSWKQRLWSLLLCAALVASLCPTALAEDGGIPYLDENGDEQLCEAYTLVTREDTEWRDGWYVVDDSLDDIVERITVTEEVHLILANGCALKVNGGINVSGGSRLTVYAQPDGGIMGSLMIEVEDTADAAIEVSSGGTVTINGGRVEATGYGGAGIGGSKGDECGNITINDGIITVTSTYGAGIGGGSGGTGGNITINGGTVEATSTYGAGIGGGMDGAGDKITISGGTVTATGNYGAGIGGGIDGAGGQITISGGEVNAYGAFGAGIGGGSGGDGGNIIINGGTVNSTGERGAGIGGGVDGAGGNITINGGTVTATGEIYGAGIGGGYEGDGGKITVSGDTVKANGVNGAGIGGGYSGGGGEIAINGGIVQVGSYGGADIGGGCGGPDGGIVPSDKIEISENAEVTQGGAGQPNIGPAEHEAKKDEWVSDSTGHWYPCKAADCAENHQFNKAAHSFGEWTIDQAATSSTAGSRHRVCGICQYRQTETIPATGGGSSGGSSGGGGYVPPTYKPDVTQPDEGGTVSVTPSRPERGDTVTVKPKPDEGYELDSITVTDRKGEPVELTAKPDGTYTFKQPGGKVKIEVSYKPVGTPETPWSNPFADVSKGDWYYEAVRFVQEQGLMSGYSDGRFAPEDTLSRSQLAQILFNKEGRPVVNYLLQYGDVSTDTWYTEAVRWAASQGIVSGYGDGTFGPDDPITREQLAVMLWRYSGSPAATNEELHFNDESQISGYALEALRWAVENGILNGDSGRLGPQDQATRAQAAQMLKSFIEHQEEDF